MDEAPEEPRPSISDVGTVGDEYAVVVTSEKEVLIPFPFMKRTLAQGISHRNIA